MKRGGEEEGFSELLQVLDEEAAGPSNDGDNHREPELEPKHTIFLSHSGVQKNFTEQLCVDLERWEYWPFFDKRPDSLPKGQKFPDIIFKAAQQCRVAVLVLSEDFFTKTKWPMLELEAFVQSQKDNPGKLSILPVYLGLSRHECTRNEIRRKKWLAVWSGWAREDPRINVKQWEKALKVLGPSNGIEYVESLGEVALREQIVGAIHHLTPPESLWSSTHVQGKSHILKTIIHKLVSTKPLGGVRVVGIYGMGGIGKTTFCKALCEKLHLRFQGRVCHAELGSNREPIELHKEVLRRLTDVNHDSLRSMEEDMTKNLFERSINGQKVFLALDNVWQESLEQAKEYLTLGFHHGSIVVVTARSIDILGCLHINKSDCLEMPDLEVEDAKQLFLHSASPHPRIISKGDESKIQYCIQHCRFRKGTDMGEHFHPLALKVLGAQLGSLGWDPNLWVESLSNDDKFNQFHEKNHPIFNILRKGYDSLCEEDQLLFMDAILFHPFQKKSFFKIGHREISSSIERDFFSLDIYKWLSIVHDLPEGRSIKDHLQVLKAKSLIEDIGDGYNGVIVHDLYLEFAKAEVKRGALNARRWVWYDKVGAYPVDLSRTPPGNCWSNVERISVKYFDHEYIQSIPYMATMEGMKWQRFSNVVVLQLFIGRNDVLDLQGLQCLKSMDLRWNYEGCVGTKSGGQLIGLGSLSNLAWLDMRNIHYAPCFQEIGQLTRLEFLRLDANCFGGQLIRHEVWRLDTNCSGESPCSEPLEPPNLDNCIHLQELVLECTCLVSFPNLSKLTSLKKILFIGCRNAKELVGLGSQMTSLQDLLLFGCDSLKQCHGLGDAISLQQLVMQHCLQFSPILDLHKLTKLRQLIIWGNKVNKLLGLNDSMPLRELRVNASEIYKLPSLHLLRHLRQLEMKYIRPTVMPRFDNFIALEGLILDHLQKVREIHGMHSLRRLKRLSIRCARNLLQLPDFGDLIALQYVDLHGCCSLLRNLDLPDLHNLMKLEVLKIIDSPIRRLPSLERLTQLRELNCSKTLLVNLPVLNGMDKLESVNLSDCRELISLENMGTLPALRDLNVTNCYSLTRLPNIRSSKSLEYLNICDSRVSLDPEDIMALVTLSELTMFDWGCDLVVPSELLEEMSLDEVVDNLEAKKQEFFNTLLSDSESEWETADEY